VESLFDNRIMTALSQLKAVVVWQLEDFVNSSKAFAGCWLGHYLP
jgi:hypothetical protein